MSSSVPQSSGNNPAEKPRGSTTAVTSRADRDDDAAHPQLSNSPRAGSRRGPHRVTSRASWALLVLSTTALAAARIPAAADYARSAVTAEQRAQLADPTLENLVIMIGVSGSVLIYAVLMLVYAGLGSFLEKRIFPASLRIWSQSVGLGWLTIALITVPLAVVSLCLGLATAPTGWVRYAASAAVVLLVPLVMSDARRSPRAYGRALLVSAPLGGLLCIQ
ncbi:MAG: hypothetical protein ACTJHU_09145 [Mycetocola sp.]